MIKICDILKLDLKDDIKNVIDLEDFSEGEIQQELESYIITEGISRHLSLFTNQFTSNIKETGVWISGFYGSGKSYFGKMLGYIIENPLINGTSARDRFIPRLKGILNESLLENDIRKLDSINSRVIFLDVAKQNTEKGLAFTLFANFLKNLGFREDIYGYIEFDLFMDDKYDEFKSKVKEYEVKEWKELKNNNRLVAKVMRNTFIKMGYSNEEYNDTYNVYSEAINNFSANKFKDELEKYTKKIKDETIVFIFDEASEAISQQKFNLLDLEGISEALSCIRNKVWTIAIAQEKLDDVINNANISKSQLTKVTDRFKTKIHLESTEVDVIIRSRLLQKKDEYHSQLVDYFRKNEGLISDATNLNSSFPTKTSSAEEFATYYPFHKYQFALLQKFLFSSNALVATQIAARGMIITTFDVLRKQMKNETLFNFTTSHAICSEAQTAPPTSLGLKYDKAKKILENIKSCIDGEKLLKTIHLLSDSELASPSVENITKSYISELKEYYEAKPKVEKALNVLVESKDLLFSNNNYKITSDLEGKLLEEMNEFDVELFIKKRELVTFIKNIKIFNTADTLNDGSESFKFNILTDLEDEISSSSNKQLKLIVYSLFNINESRQDFVESIKFATQHNKEIITLIPDNKDFEIINKLIGEIKRYAFMEEKYARDSDDKKRQIIRDFSMIKEEKEKELRLRIGNAYYNSSLIYMFDEYILNEDSFKVTINECQRKLVKNVYTKRLTNQVSESLVPKIFKDSKTQLHLIFAGEDFKFFDTNGNFTGDNLKVVEEITSKIKNKFVDGKTLEMELSMAPCGYSFGTIVSTLASLFRAGRLVVRFNGETFFDYHDKVVNEAFTNATRFKLAAFKYSTITLTAAQKKEVVSILMDLDIERHTDGKIKVDWNTTDFELADSIKGTAEHFLSSLATLKDTIPDFELLFPKVIAQKNILQNYSGKTTENNYIEKVECLLNSVDDFKAAVEVIIKSQSFIKKDFEQVKKFKFFIDNVYTELRKADKSDSLIEESQKDFNQLYTQDMIKNFGEIKNKVQIVKDAYYKLISNSSKIMSEKYKNVLNKIEAAMYELKQKYSEELNLNNINKLNELKEYCLKRIDCNLSLDYSITCKNSGFSLSDIMNYIDLATTKESEIIIIQGNFIAKSEGIPQLDINKNNTPKQPRKVRLHIDNKIMKVHQYKAVLMEQLSNLAAASAEEEIELIIEGNENEA